MKQLVKLHAYTDSYHDNLEQYVAYVARVSNPGNQHNDRTASRLIDYLISNKHWSPFEMASICLEINTTIDIGRQILRHRSFSFQEFSQRYAEVVDFQGASRDARLQDNKNRQNSIDTDNNDLDIEFKARQVNQQASANANYQWALNQGIAKEQARVFLPEGLTPTRMYMSGSLRSWIHYIELRSGKGTQKEHREIAIMCAEAIKSVFPKILEFVQ